MRTNWDKKIDVLVVGSGAGGMVAALAAAQNNADVLITEKANLWGGRSASSGGMDKNGEMRKADAPLLPNALYSGAVTSNTDHSNRAAKGQDPDFHRGEAAYDKMYGDPRQTPNSCLRAIDQGPFYAMPIYPRDIGMNGGLKTNEKAQVIDTNNKPISGLYAVGNNAASAMGESYPGAGVTLMPAMTFGFIAAQYITRSNQEIS